MLSFCCQLPLVLLVSLLLISTHWSPTSANPLSKSKPPNFGSESPVFHVPLQVLLDVGRQYPDATHYLHISPDAHPEFLRDEFLEPSPHFFRGDIQGKEKGRDKWDLYDISNHGDLLGFTVVAPESSENVKKTIIKLGHQRGVEDGVAVFCLEKETCQNYGVFESHDNLPAVMIPPEWAQTRVESDSLLDTRSVLNSKARISLKEHTNQRILPYLVTYHLLQQGITSYYVDPDIEIHVDMMRQALRLMHDHQEVHFYGLVDTIHYKDANSPYRTRFKQQVEQQFKRNPEEEEHGTSRGHEGNEGQEDLIDYVDVTTVQADLLFLEPLASPQLFIAQPSTLTLRFFELVIINLLKRPQVKDQVIFNEALDVMGMKINGINSSKVKLWNCENYKASLAWKEEQ